MPPMKMVHEQDPATTIRNKIGKALEDVTIFGNYILLGVYERPEKTKSGLYLSDQTRSEDKHQGKAGIVLKKGPTAFVSDHNCDFKGQNVEVGEWVSIWVSDGRALYVNGQLCRLVEDQHVRLKVPTPDLVY